ncbi:hypothetical protein ANRL4_03407 [Anaerolineae bacterium]|nr:hypothetical protein ANRL4_03407 [Anaerolineae bacterium]
MIKDILSLFFDRVGRLELLGIGALATVAAVVAYGMEGWFTYQNYLGSMIMFCIVVVALVIFWVLLKGILGIESD